MKINEVFNKPKVYTIRLGRDSYYVIADNTHVSNGVNTSIKKAWVHWSAGIKRLRTKNVLKKWRLYEDK